MRRSRGVLRPVLVSRLGIDGLMDSKDGRVVRYLRCLQLSRSFPSLTEFTGRFAISGLLVILNSALNLALGNTNWASLTLTRSLVVPARSLVIPTRPWVTPTHPDHLEPGVNK